MKSKIYVDTLSEKKSLLEGFAAMEAYVSELHLLKGDDNKRKAIGNAPVQSLFMLGDFFKNVKVIAEEELGSIDIEVADAELRTVTLAADKRHMSLSEFVTEILEKTLHDAEADIDEFKAKTKKIMGKKNGKSKKAKASKSR